MNLGGVTHITHVVSAEMVPSPPGAGATPSLLPSPTSLGTEGLVDAAALLLELTLEANRRQLNAQKADVAAASGQRELHMKELDKKFQEWVVNQSNPFRGLADVFKGIGIALSSIAAAMTGGSLSGLMIAAIALSAASFVVEKTEMLGPEASKWVSMVMGAASAVMSGGTNLAALGSAAGTMGNSAAEALRSGVDVARTTLALGEDGVHIGEAVIEHNQAEREADVKESQNRLEQVRRIIGLLIEGLKELNQTQRRAVETVADTIRVSCETSAMVAAGTRV
jgi:hypothetical protein